MIDRAARDNLAELARHLVAGTIKTDDFMAALAHESQDDAIEPLWFEIDGFYDDVSSPWSHRLRGRRAVTPEGRAYVARLIVFLYSDLEWSGERARAESDVWPFGDRGELCEAMARPRAGDRNWSGE